MAERSQKKVWRLTPWLVIVLLLGNFLLMAFDARDIPSGQRVIRVWSQTAADFVQSPVTTISSAVFNYFGSISNLRTAQSENDLLKKRVQELDIENKGNEDLAAENAQPAVAAGPQGKKQDHGPDRPDNRARPFDLVSIRRSSTAEASTALS